MSQRDPDSDSDSDTTLGDKYGWSIGLSPNGDLNRNAIDQYQIKSDEPLVVQSLRVCLLTPKGYDPLRPEYGLNVFQAFGTNDSELRMAIRDAIGPDATGIERVERIEDIDIDRTVGVRHDVDVNISVVLADPSAGPFNFSFALRSRNYPLTGGGE